MLPSILWSKTLSNVISTAIVGSNVLVNLLEMFFNPPSFSAVPVMDKSKSVFLRASCFASIGRIAFWCLSSCATIHQI